MLLDLFLSFYVSSWETELKNYRNLSNPMKMNENRFYVLCQTKSRCDDSRFEK